MPKTNTFSLTNSLPTQFDGHDIKTGHRVIMRCLKMLADPEIADADRADMLQKMFCPDCPEPLEAFGWFVSLGRERDDDEPERVRDVDYQQDATEIYSAFMQVYGIDLFCEQLHWWRFSALMSGLFATDNALSNKVRLRHMDDSEAERKAATRRAKEAAQIRDAVSISEAMRNEELEAALMAGRPINDLLRR